MDDLLKIGKTFPIRFSLTIIIISTLVTLLQTGCHVSRIPEQAEIKYDIQGDWEITSIIYTRIKVQRVFTFIGAKKKGTIMPPEGISGPYKVGGEKGTAVEFFFWSYDENGAKVYEYYRGNFIDNNYMEGTGTYTEDQQHFGGGIAWGAHRVID